MLPFCSVLLFYVQLYFPILDLDEQIAEMSLQMSSKHWECTMCGKVSQQKSDLKKHIESLHLHLDLPCMLCPKVFRTRHSRFSHLRKIHGVSNKWIMYIHWIANPKLFIALRLNLVVSLKFYCSFRFYTNVQIAHIFNFMICLYFYIYYIFFPIFLATYYFYNF